MNRTITVVLGVLAIGLSEGSSPAVAQGPDPSQVYIQSITYGGTACPQGSASLSLSSDRTRFTLIFDNYVATTGPGVPIIESRKNCQININLHVPSGVGNAIVSLDYRGFLQLEAGAQASQHAIYFFADNEPKEGGTDFAGPVAKDYIQSDAVPLLTQKLDLPVCGGTIPLNVSSQVRIDSGAGPNMITTDSIDGSVKTTGRPPDVNC